MKRIQIASHPDMKERDAVEDVRKFIAGDAPRYGKIMAIYGLRRTGKTTIMQQAVYNCGKPYAFYELSPNDSMDEVYQALEKERSSGTDVVCFDEITNADDFITDAAYLADVFACQGMHIIVSGTDSLGLRIAENSELFDRTIDINTTHIPFAEHSRVLGISDIDDYIEYGGLMRRGKQDIEVDSWIDAKRYLDSAVADNISRSLKKSIEDDPLEVLSQQEMRTIIEKLVENYSGKINVKLMQNELKKASITQPLKHMPEADPSVISHLIVERKNITSDFLKEINASGRISHQITYDMVESLETHLMDMNALSAVPFCNFRHYNDVGWTADGIEHDYYVIQPAIKYYHLDRGQKFIASSSYFQELPLEQRKLMQSRLSEEIKGDMIEQIVLFDTIQALGRDKYQVIKPIFYEEGKLKGEYDMLICDIENERHWAFEIKHTENAFEEQKKHLKNADFSAYMERQFGHRENAYVIYRGATKKSEDGIGYLNVRDFSEFVHRYRNIEKALEHIDDKAPQPKQKKHSAESH